MQRERERERGGGGVVAGIRMQQHEADLVANDERESFFWVYEALRKIPQFPKIKEKIDSSNFEKKMTHRISILICYRSSSS